MKKNLLSQKIGIIGGGQLGKMMILEAKKLGFYVITLDPSPDCPSHSISDEHMVNAFDDKAAIRRLAEKCDCITYEFEHIDSDILMELENEGHKIYPTAASLKIIQDKYNQKTRLAECGIDVGEFIKIENIADMKKAGEMFGYPYILKARTGGYDGKGNAIAENEERITEVYNSLDGGKIPLMAEKLVPFVMETSVLACRGQDGTVKVYPVGDNRHIESILHETVVPAKISEKAYENARNMANEVMEAFDGIGMFCVELFVTEDERVVLNEVAPRPHNSGHYTIEACTVSQFENHIRAVTGLPLGDTSLLTPVSMVNILGEEGYSGKAAVVGAEDVLSIPGVTLHIYGKSETRPKRKMGHITAIAPTAEEASRLSSEAYDKIKIISGE